MCSLLARASLLLFTPWMTASQRRAELSERGMETEGGRLLLNSWRLCGWRDRTKKAQAFKYKADETNGYAMGHKRDAEGSWTGAFGRKFRTMKVRCMLSRCRRRTVILAVLCMVVLFMLHREVFLSEGNADGKQPRSAVSKKQRRKQLNKTRRFRQKSTRGNIYI